ncbi:transcriptional regulator [Aeromicrobium sp. Root495]|uniref:LCP family protein n=1 Tax=Aeromicrobium sp. Root495 TaxID=1736550 RepID=UPI0006F3232E|nr:LCP family protein [Aeromicrobium sp. Root495]KQY60596.1 transcriptional regulator [Aeromicrobium sp. Root495]
MPEQRPEDRYGWLYGGAGEDDRATQVAPAGPDLPPPNLPPPGRGGRGPGGSDGGGGSSRRRAGTGKRVFRIVVVVLLAWLAYLVIAPWHAYSTVSKVESSPSGDRPGSQPGTTFLLVGSDSRKGLTKAEQKELSTGGDGGGRGRTDTIMLLHSGSGPSLLMSIPRDSIVDIPGYGTTKINAAYAFGGPKLLVKTIEQNTGIAIDDYVEVGFGGLVNVVDALGGVEICPKENLKDKDSGLDVKKGCQDVDGRTALAYSRNRHSFASQDIQRVQSQREVMSGIAQRAARPSTFLNPFRYWGVTHGAASSVQVGDSTGAYDLVKFALALKGAMGQDGLSCTVPVADFSVRWDPERSQKMFGYIKADRTQSIGDLCTKDGLPKGS